MKILFIGGTGNISTDCAAWLYERGHEISVVSRGKSAVPAEYRTIIADRKDLAGMRSALAGQSFDVVLNFIGYELPEVQVDYELFQGRVQQYIFISTATVYAKPPPSLPIRESSPFGNPFWDYAQKKLVCEQWLLERWQENRFPITIVRPSHTYSKGWIPNPISSSSYTFAARLEQGKAVWIHDGGATPWTLTATSDFAAALGGLVGNPQALGEAFHLTSDEALTWKQIYYEIAAALGISNPRIIPIPTDFICEIAPRLTGTLKGDKAHPGVFDNTKLKRFVPGFQARKPFRVGVRESVEWLRAHPEQQNLNPQLDAETETILATWANKLKGE